jgi:carotenoid 1,2-hydratase
MSDDKQCGVVVIVFVGSVFSPFYFAARSRFGSVDPLDYCAFNVAVYHHGKRIWGFTEWSQSRVEREADTFVIGNNRICRGQDRIVIDIDETSPTEKERITGRVVIHPKVSTGRTFTLDARGAHRWHPVAPLGEIDVNLTEPPLCFKGSAYHDANEGDEPLEAALRQWSWSRHEVAGETVVLYDGVRRDDTLFSLALRFRADDTLERVAPPPVHKLPCSFWWRCPRTTRTESAGRSRVVRTLEDSPFYARTLLECTLLGEPAPGVHESLVLDKFTTKWMQWMLPYRIKRV